MRQLSFALLLNSTVMDCREGIINFIIFNKYPLLCMNPCSKLPIVTLLVLTKISLNVVLAGWYTIMLEQKFI